MLRLVCLPTPTCFSLFLTHNGGLFLKSLICLENNNCGCGCRDFTIYENSINKKKFVIITSHHLIKLTKTVFDLNFFDKIYHCTLVYLTPGTIPNSTNRCIKKVIISYNANISLQNLPDYCCDLNSIYVSHLWLQLKLLNLVKGKYARTCTFVKCNHRLLSILNNSIKEFTKNNFLKPQDVSELETCEDKYKYNELTAFDWLNFWSFSSLYIKRICSKNFCNIKKWQNFGNCSIEQVHKKLNNLLGLDYNKRNLIFAKLILKYFC